MNDNKTGVFFRITLAQKEVLNQVAKNEERSLQAVFNRALREYVSLHHGIKYHSIEDDLAELLQS